MSRVLPTCLTTQEQHALAEFQRRVHTALGASLVQLRLFGSRARCEGNAESDLDVLVLLQTANREEKHAVWNIASDLLLETELYISPLVMSKAGYEQLLDRERLIALDIERDGVPL